jgi:hypothetical protein
MFGASAGILREAGRFFGTKKKRLPGNKKNNPL